MKKAALVIYHIGFLCLLLYAAFQKAFFSFTYIALLFILVEGLIIRKQFRKKRPYAYLGIIYLVAAFCMAWYRINIAPGIESEVERSIVEHGFITPFVVYLVYNYLNLRPFENWTRRKRILATFIIYNIMGVINESLQSYTLRDTFFPLMVQDTYVDLGVNLVASGLLLLPWLFLKNPFADKEEDQ